MSSPDQTKDGTIIFFKRDAMSQWQRVEFTKAYCVSHEEEFNGKTYLYNSQND
ncbi:type VI secretion system tube protein TssD [Maribacter luteus]|uniref:type VI secretion system tube protein TssD n=1 Tax=Maribacter luteus TaxID=2594478 RepID=UPI0024906209|nr:type VI secretion system tube protein TssD [Maribacter luteus]